MNRFRIAPESLAPRLLLLCAPGSRTTLNVRAAVCPSARPVSGRAIQERFESDSKAIRIPRGDSARLAYGFRSDSSATTSPLYNIKTYMTISSGPRGEGAGKRDSRILPSSGFVLQRTEEVPLPPGPFGAQRPKERKNFSAPGEAKPIRLCTGLLVHRRLRGRWAKRFPHRTAGRRVAYCGRPS